MSIDIGIVLLLVWLHFVSDFLLQTNTMSRNKSTSNKWLGIHVAVYSLPFLIFGPLYAIINGLAHFATDYVSSRFNTHFWEKEDYRKFFITVGCDQAVHLTTLIATYVWLFG